MGCVECHSTELVENHHVTPKADLSACGHGELAKLTNAKPQVGGGADDTIPLCRSCHLKLHGLNGDFRRWTSAWHEYYKETDPEGYREHQRKAGQGRQRQLRRLLGEDGYKEHQRRLALIRWKVKDGI